jgi:hypothetical protein
MTQVFPDTSPETERALFAMLREMPAWRKLEMVAQLNQAGRELALADTLSQCHTGRIASPPG